MKKIIIIFIAASSMFCANAQTEEEYDEFIKLYKENYLEWISSPEIALLQERNPDLKELIANIPIQETNAYKKAYLEAQKTRGKEFNLVDVLGEGAVDVSMDIIKELLAEENTDIIINLYWKIIKSAKSQEIVDLIMPHILKAKKEVETAGVEITNIMKEKSK